MVRTADIIDAIVADVRDVARTVHTVGYPKDSPVTPGALVVTAAELRDILRARLRSAPAHVKRLPKRLVNGFLFHGYPDGGWRSVNGRYVVEGCNGSYRALIDGVPLPKTFRKFDTAMYAATENRRAPG